MAPKKATASSSALPRRLAGKTIAVAASLKEWDQEPFEELLKAEGGQLVEEVTAALDYLVLGTPLKLADPARKQARQLNKTQGGHIQVLKLRDFANLLHPDRDLAVSLLRAGPPGAERLTQLRRLVGPALDLSGADLRGIDTGELFLDFGKVCLDQADLSQARLERVELSRLEGARLNGVKARGRIHGPLIGCSLRKADLCKADLGSCRLEDCDLTGANLEGIQGYKLQVSNCKLPQVRLVSANLYDAKFSGIDLTGANLHQARLAQADLSNALLPGADLGEADLTGANLSGGDLTGADLKGANLFDADLTNARVEGASFEGANLSGTKLTGTDPGKAHGLEQPAGLTLTVGPHLKELASLVALTTQFKANLKLEPPEGRFLGIEFTAFPQSRYFWANSELSGDGGYYSSKGKTIDVAMMDMVRRWPGSKLKVDGITVLARGVPQTEAELQRMLRAAWCETAGLPIPTDEEVEQQRQQHFQELARLKEEALADLRGGKAGVQRWNQRDSGELYRVGPFRNANLAGAKLTGVNLSSKDFQGATFEEASFGPANLEYGSFQKARFRKAQFRKANLRWARFTSAKFEDAALIQCNLTGANLRQANLKNANLSSACLLRTELQGADLTGTTLTGATFDEHTQFPVGFLLPNSLVWAGEEPDPRTVTPPPAGQPIDLKSFMEQLRKAIDPSRLAKALDMLKAERFQLFSQADDKELTGVVKSQSVEGLVYSCRLASDGSSHCCTQKLNVCGGLRGALCKHLLVLIVGLAQAEQVEPGTIARWVQASSGKRPVLDRDSASAILLRYKGAESGEVDWRPTETIPEDFYAF